jgi:hypothetical protein
LGGSSLQVPNAAVAPIAGAPRTYISRMEVATPVTSVKVAILSSMGKRRWSIILTVPWSHSTVRMRYLQT